MVSLAFRGYLHVQSIGKLWPFIMYMYFAHILVCVSLFGHCVIFHLPHTHTLPFPSFSHSSLISLRIYYARILRAACFNLLLYFAACPGGDYGEAIEFLCVVDCCTFLSLSHTHIQTHPYTYRAVWHAILMCLALAISFCSCFARFARIIIKAFSICSWNF